MISDLVSELFNNIDSKESFDYISNLLLNSLNSYKDTFSSEYNSIAPEITTKETVDKRINYSFSNISGGKADYLTISKDIQSILSNCPDLTTSQKLDYCNNQRYFMKMYLRNIVIKLKNQ
ncbi:MAG: hypothetical protein ACFFCI_08585 [Promethearchaeota archaeon]